MAFAELGDARRAWAVWNLINPLPQGASPAAIEIYKVEPDVVAADVHAVSPPERRSRSRRLSFR